MNPTNSSPPAASPAASSAPGSLRRIAARVTLMALPLIVVAALFELVVSLLGIAPPPTNPLIVWNPRRDAELSSGNGEFRENARWLWEPRPGAIVVGAAINDDGYRGPALPRERGGRLRIATLGDSTTYGIGVPEAESWSRVLETVLRGQGYDVEIANFGCVGFTAVQGLALYRGRVREFRPDVVIAAFGCVNEQFPTLPALTDTAKLRTLSSPWHRVRVVLRRLDAFRWLEAKVSTPIVPPSGDVDPSVAVPRVSVDEYRTALTDLAAAVRDDGGALVLVSPPRRLDGESESPRTLDYTHAIESLAPALGAGFADVHSVLRQLVAEEFQTPTPTLDQARRSTYFADPWHPSPKGHRAYAVCVGQTLLEKGLLRKSP